MDIRFGDRNISFPGSDMGEMHDCNQWFSDMATLYKQIASDGYLFIRGLIDRTTVLQARETVLEYLAKKEALVPHTPSLEGVMPQGGKSVTMNDIAHNSKVLAVVEGKELYDFFKRFFGEPTLTFSKKWLRAVGNQKFTGAHMDSVYMGRGSVNLHTVWIPFGDIPAEQGTLAICPNSNHLESFARIRQTYGRMDVDRDLVEGWFSREPMEIVEKFGSQWLTANFSAGDVVIFGMNTMHASTTNLTNRFRLSCDVRFQPASDPVDERWSKPGKGHTAKKWQIKVMSEARREWNVE